MHRLPKKLTFQWPDDNTIEKAVSRFRANAELLAFAGIKLSIGGKYRSHDEDEVDAEIVAAICRAWLAATED